jgi:ubiquinone/menaquinone biosynthesis C-methylase UbiE
MTHNKNHWYDGKFYDKLIAPNQDFVFKQIKEIIEENSTVLDIGCGTGRLAFQLNAKCESIDGIDLSNKNINTARKNLEKYQSKNITFHHADAGTFLNKAGIRYNYAVLTYVIHEINEIDRIKIIKQIFEKAEKLIIADYLVPRPKGFLNIINEIVEFLAGKEHYKNFKSFVKKKGLYGLTEKSGLVILNEIKNIPFTAQIMVLEKNYS